MCCTINNAHCCIHYDAINGQKMKIIDNVVVINVDIFEEPNKTIYDIVSTKCAVSVKISYVMTYCDISCRKFIS